MSEKSLLRPGRLRMQIALADRIVCFRQIDPQAATSPQGRLDPDLCTTHPRRLHPGETAPNDRLWTRRSPRLSVSVNVNVRRAQRVRSGLDHDSMPLRR